jgi:CspA family cold shock protein
LPVSFRLRVPVSVSSHDQNLMRRAQFRTASRHHLEDNMPTGTVKWFNSTKGYGFIQPDDGSKDVFLHVSALEQAGLGPVGEGQKLTYEVERGRDGKTAAANVRAV